MYGYIFDLDGTLLDSMGVWEQVDVDFLSRRGLAVPADYMNSIAVMSFPEAAAYTIERFALPDTPETLMAEWNELAQEAYGSTVQLKPGAREYLTALRARGLKVAVATSCYRSLYERAFDNLGLAEFFDAIATTAEAGASKIQPDVFLLAAQKLGVEPEACVVFEDIPEAVCSAKAAGMRVYGIYDEYAKDHWERIEAMADGVFRDFTEVPLPEPTV